MTRRVLENDRVARLLRSSLVRNVSGSFLLQIFALVMRFVSSVVLARLLTTSDYGTLTYVVSWMVTIAVPAKLGFDLLLLREVAAYRAQEQWSRMRGLVHVALIVGVSLSAIIAVALFIINLRVQVPPNLFLLPPAVLTPMVNQTGLQAFWIGLLLLPTLVLLSIQSRIIRGFNAIIWSQLPQMVFAPIAFLILFGVAYLSLGHLMAQQVIALRAIAFVGALLYSTYLLRRTLPAAFTHARADYSNLSDWFARVLPMLGSTFFISLYARVDVLMLGSLRGVEEVAYYNIVLVIANLVTMVLTAANTSLGPLISEYYASGQMDKLQRLVVKSARGILAASLPIVAVLIIGGDLMLSIYGEEYRASYPVLLILIIGQFVNMATGPAGILLSMTNHERYTFLGRAIGLAIYVGLNALLIPRWGGIGAAVATTLSLTFLNVFQVWFSWRKLGIVPIATSKLRA